MITHPTVVLRHGEVGELSSGLRALARFVAVVAAVVTYVALHFAITAGFDLRDRDAFHDAPEQYAAFLTAVDRLPSSIGEVRAVAAWFEENAPSGSESRPSIWLGASLAEDGSANVLKVVDDVPAEIDRDRAALDAAFDASAEAARPWLEVSAALLVLVLLFRYRRRTANAEVVELVSRFVPHRPRWRRPVFLVVSGVGYLLMVSGFLSFVTATRAKGIPWSVRGFMLLGCVVALVIAYFVLRCSRPRSARGAVQALRADGRTPVLYLRSFGDDATAARVDEMPGALSTALLSVSTREEQLVEALGAFGPVIAVGRPREPLPHLGAARFYLPFHDWQPGVLRLMELCRLIVLRLGEGDGLWWEVDQASTTQPAGKLVLLVPGERDGLGERLDEHLPKPTGLDGVVTGTGLWTAAVVVFGPDWTPRVVPVAPVPGQRAPRGSAAHHVARAVQEALDSVGVRKRAMALRVNSGLLLTIGKVLLLIPLAALVVRFLRLVGLW